MPWCAPASKRLQLLSDLSPVLNIRSRQLILQRTFPIHMLPPEKDD